MDVIYKAPYNHSWEQWKSLGLRYLQGGYYIANGGKAGHELFHKPDDGKVLEEVRCRFNTQKWECYRVPCTDIKTAQRIMIAHRFQV